MVTRAGTAGATVSDDRHANSVWLLPVAALGGVVAGLSVWLAFESNHVDQPGIQAFGHRRVHRRRRRQPAHGRDDEVAGNGRVRVGQRVGRATRPRAA